MYRLKTIEYDYTTKGVTKSYGTVEEPYTLVKLCAPDKDGYLWKILATVDHVGGEMKYKKFVGRLAVQNVKVDFSG